MTSSTSQALTRRAFLRVTAVGSMSARALVGHALAGSAPGRALVLDDAYHMEMGMAREVRYVA